MYIQAKGVLQISQKHLVDCKSRTQHTAHCLAIAFASPKQRSKYKSKRMSADWKVTKNKTNGIDNYCAVESSNNIFNSLIPRASRNSLASANKTHLANSQRNKSSRKVEYSEELPPRRACGSASLVLHLPINLTKGPYNTPPRCRINLSFLIYAEVQPRKLMSSYCSTDI